MQRYSEQMAIAWTIADSFNRRFPIGSVVKLQTESGAVVDHTTASEAFALPDASVSIMLRTKGDSVSPQKLDRVLVPKDPA